MLTWLRQFLTAPEYPGDPERTVLGRMFNIGCLVLLAASIAAAVNNLLVGDLRVGLIMIAAIALMCTLIVAVRRGHLKLASLVLPPVMLVTFIVGPLTRDGVHDSATVAIAATMVMAGVLMQWRALLAFVAVAVGAFFAMGYVEIAGLLHNRFAGFTDFRFLVGVCISFVFVAVIVRVLTNTMLGSLRESRSAQDRLERSEERFAKMIQATPAATTITRYEDGTFLEANRAALELFGRSRDEVIGATALSLGLWPNPEDRARLMAAMRADGSVNLRPLPVRRKTGETRDTLVSAAWVEIDRQKQMLMSAVDITDARRTEELLRRSEERFEKIFRASPGAIVITRLSDGRYLEVNQRWLELFGYEREEMIGRTSLDLGAWADPAERTRFVEQIRERGSLRDYEAQFRKKSGAVVDALVSAEAIEIEGEPHIIVPLTDITDRKRFAALLDSIARGVASRTGEEFFREVVLCLCKELPADMAFIGEIVPPGDRIRTIACCRDGELSDNFDYALAGSPCIGTLERRGTTVYAERAAELFPEDTGLANRAIEGYVGTSLMDTAGKAIGILVALTRVPIARKEFFVSLVEIFASRAAAEIERSRAEERIQQLATRDALTGLPNRLLLNDRLTLSISHARRQGGSLALLFIDLDRFKYINDSLGHVIGDAFLKRVAERLSGIMRQGDTLARIGGDEFVVLLENIVTMEDAAGQVARKILACFAEPFSVQGHTLSCSCSVGISVFPSDATEPQMLIRDADTAMYHVKDSGRGSYRYFSAEMNTRMQERLQVEIGLRKAIAERQFELAYQPKVNIASGKVVGLEALLRWRHPEWGVVAPGRFIAVAEDTALIVEIGRWVLEEVCRQLREWRDHGFRELPVAVNLSVRQFNPALVGEISAAMVAHGVAPGQIEVEITESLFMQNAEEVRAILKGLSRLGARVTIDDFGTGYSSLGYIRHFSVDALKIDRAFLSDISSSSPNLAIVRAVITMCRGLGIGVIAEGVETKEQLEILRKLRCDEYQGYLYSHPVSAEEIARRHLRAVPERKVLSGQR